MDTAGNLNSGATGQSRTLLLVDDEPMITAAIVRLVRRDGYRILTARSGAEGLHVLSGAEVPVIVSDLSMPEMNGSEFFCHVAKLYPAAIRILMSGNAEQRMVDEAINQGVIHKFITKPWDSELLRDEIRAAFVLHEARKKNR